MDYWMAPDHIEERAKEILAQHHPEVATANFAYIFKAKANKSELERGQVCTAKKVNDLYKTLTGDVDFIIVVANEQWHELSETQKDAKLDSALSCCSVKFEDGDVKLDESGNPIWVIQSPDIYEFSEIIERYGLEVLSDAGERLRSVIEAE